MLYLLESHISNNGIALTRTSFERVFWNQWCSVLKPRKLKLYITKQHLLEVEESFDQLGISNWAVGMQQLHNQLIDYRTNKGP